MLAAADDSTLAAADAMCVRYARRMRFSCKHASAAVERYHAGRPPIWADAGVGEERAVDHVPPPFPRPPTPLLWGTRSRAPRRFSPPSRNRHGRPPLRAVVRIFSSCRRFAECRLYLPAIPRHYNMYMVIKGSCGKLTPRHPPNGVRCVTATY